MICKQMIVFSILVSNVYSMGDQIHLTGRLTNDTDCPFMSSFVYYGMDNQRQIKRQVVANRSLFAEISL